MADDDIPDRVSALENEVKEVRVLAAGADHDVSEVKDVLRAHTRAINALRADQVVLREEMRDGFLRVDHNFARVEQQFVLVRAGLGQIVGLIEAITPE